MGPAAHRRSASSSALALMALVMLVVLVPLVALSAATVRAQADDASSMCLLTLDELNDASGLAFVTSDEARGACSYASDPAIDMYALDLRIDTDDSTLDGIRFQYDRGGRDTTVAGFPAWSSDDGLFVDLGERLLVVQPIFFLAASELDPVAAQEAVAELAAPRASAAVEAAFGGEDRLTALFPAEIAGMPLFVDVMNGRDFLSFVDLGNAAIEEVLASQGLTLDDLSIGTASTSDGDITALQVPGMDAALLLPAVSERFSALGATATPTERAGKALISFPGQPFWLYASGDVLWMITQPDEAALDAILEVLP
jgi:hypothetical protein